jgi:hypothetical protein
MQAQAVSLVARAAVAPCQSAPSSLEFVSPEPVRGGCGYFDSSFELNHGLRVTEESDPILLQLWVRVLDSALSLH